MASGGLIRVVSRLREGTLWLHVIASLDFKPIRIGVKCGMKPGNELVVQGIEDLANGRKTFSALLVSIGAPRLRRSGIAIANTFDSPELRLYEHLRAANPDSAHSRYNALIRRLVSFERATECRPNYRRRWVIRTMRITKATCIALLLATLAFAQAQGDRQQFIRVEAPVIALTNVRVIDGTGAAPLENQTIVISGGKIDLIGPTAATTYPSTAKSIDLTGYTVLPGLVGMHNHLFFPEGGSPPIYSDMAISFPRLYLALGVTTIRTTGSVAPYTDLEVKKRIDAGQMIGPKMHITAPYLEGKGSFTPVMHELTGVEDARRMVNFWADQGATSFKAYMNISRAELRAAVEEAHKRGLKVTGHLCSIGYKEAAEIGIDNLEHGLFANSEYVADKKPDQCPAGVSASLRQLDINGPAVKETIRVLVEKKVAITSTMPVFEASAPIAQEGIGAASALLNPRMLNTMSQDARVRYLSNRARVPATSPAVELIRKAMAFELAFARAGGLLIAGLDPTGNGGVVAGFGDLRGLELFVEGGFTPLEAIKIYTFNGAKFLGEDARIGSIAVGKQADLMVVKGNPAAKISDIQNVEIVFKDGVGWDTEKLIQSVQSLVGVR